MVAFQTNITVMQTLIFVVWIFISFVSSNIAHGKRDNKLFPRTIQNKYGDLYDCVEIYNQPSLLGHPLLKDHKIQMRPTFIPRFEFLSNDDINSISSAFKLEGLKEKCPEGTIPISSKRRPMQTHELIENKSSFFMGQTNNKAFQQKQEGNGYHFAGIHTKKDSGKTFHGAKTIMNIYNPSIGEDQMSGALISIQNESQERIEAGWMVNPKIYGDKKTHLFGFWSVGNKGCYNMLCPGFILVNSSIPIDMVFDEVSEFGVTEIAYSLEITQDKTTGNWWLGVGFTHIQIGYWPAEIFNSLKGGANYIELGGQVYASPTEPYPVMGTGTFDEDLYLATAYFKQIQFGNELYEAVIPESTYMELVSYRCFLSGINHKGGDVGYSFMYGGPGGKDDTCLP